LKKFKLVLVAVAMATSSMAMAQSGKAALIKQFIDLQRPAIESLARGLTEQSSAPIAQAGSQYLQTQVPAEKREAVLKAADAELKKYSDSAYPIIRDKALQVAPAALGPLLDQTFSEDELRQLVAWISSPVAKKYQDLNPKMQTALGEQVVAETRATIEPKLHALDASVAKALGAPANPAAPAAAKPPAKK
jgi:hypothetical protein